MKCYFGEIVEKRDNDYRVLVYKNNHFGEFFEMIIPIEKFPAKATINNYFTFLMSENKIENISIISKEKFNLREKLDEIEKFSNDF